MNLNLKEILLENAPLKAVSCILGCALWSLLGQMYTVHRSFTVPLCFYALKDDMTLTAPETIKIIVAGKRTTLSYLKLENIVAHVDARSFEEGKNRVSLTEEELFLPSSIKLVDYCPSNIVVTAVKQEPLLTL